MTNLVSLWTDMRRRFEAASIESPVLDARLLLEKGAGVARTDIITDPRRALTPAQVEAVEALAQRRLAREPVAHIIGRKGFWTFDLAVSPAVLIPRPETEVLVETALALLPRDRPARVLDLGVGSGAILLAILSERPLASGTGVDASKEALAVAQANAEALGLAARASFRMGDWAAGIVERFDLAVSNPPYIPRREIDTLAPEVARFEPRLALDGGADGLEAYRAIIPSLPQLLAAGGGFAMEVGAGQAQMVNSLLENSGLRAQPTRVDLAGHGRVVWGQLA